MSSLTALTVAIQPPTRQALMHRVLTPVSHNHHLFPLLTLSPPQCPNHQVADV